MNRLTKKIVGGSLVVILSSAAVLGYAKGSDRGEHTAERFDYIFTQLSLTETQQADVLAVLEQHRESFREEMKAQKALLEESGEDLSREDMREAMRAMNTQLLTDQLNTVLSPNVTADMVEYLDAHKGMDRGHRKGKHKGGKDDQDTDTAS